MTSGTQTQGRFTGRHMLGLMVAFFGIIIGVNVMMAHYATSTFGGTVVDNSYVASQKFNRWLDQADREKALGWSVAMRRGNDDRLTVTLASDRQDLAGARVTAVARHPLGRQPERALTFRKSGGVQISTGALPPGRWIVHLTVEANGTSVHRIFDQP